MHHSRDVSSPSQSIKQHNTIILLQSLFPDSVVKKKSENECLPVVILSVNQVSDDTRFQQNWHYIKQQILPHPVFQSMITGKEKC